MTKAELVDLAAERGLDVKPSGSSAEPLKDDYIKALEKADASPR
jgi:hypothetical protein